MSDLTVVCVDPDQGEREATADALADAGYTVARCATVAEAVDRLGEGGDGDADGDATTADHPGDGRDGGTATTADCVVTEYDLPDGTGLDLAARIRERAPDTPCILFTNRQPDRIATDGHEGVVVEYLPKDVPEARSSVVRLIGNVVAERTQVGYPLPPDEDERLATLAQYDQPGLDMADAFDRLTELAASHFGVDVALVGLVDAHEERFLSCSGASWETIAREDSMCTHTILEDRQFVVEDVGTDPRFAENEHLAEHDIEAYAGIPLRSPDGAAIGAFCLTHDEPRTFTDPELADLHRFAEETMEQLELRRRLGETEAAADAHTDGGPLLERRDDVPDPGGDPS